MRQIEEYKASVGMTDEIFSNKEVKDKTISSEEKREEYIDKEITPIYIVEEWKDNKGNEIKGKNREVVDVSVKETNLTEHNGDRETVTVVTDDEEGNEAREEVSNSDYIPRTGNEGIEGEKTSALTDRNKSQNIRNQVGLNVNKS